MPQKKDYKNYVIQKNNELVDFITKCFAKAKLVDKKPNKDLCVELGITHTTYINFCTGIYSMSLKNVLHILNHFGYTLNITKKGGTKEVKATDL